MKFRYPRLFPQSFIVCVTPLLACIPASAGVIQFNEQASVPGGNPIPWTLPTGTNLLAAATPTPATSAASGGVGEGTSVDWTITTNGALGTPSQNAQSVAPPNNEVVTFALNLAGHATGYNITSFDSYCAWGDSGRDNQQYTLAYSVVGDETNFITIGSFENNSGNPNNCTHINLTDSTGYLAQGVHSIRVTFGGNQENGYTGFRELVVRASEPPTPVITALNESNSTNIWTLPGGLNLLNGATANTPSAPADTNHGNNEITSSSWATLTNGSVGTYTDLGSSVGPLNNTSVIFPLNTTTNTKGYNISSFDSFGAWVNSGRDNQDFSILYSKWDAPGVFIPLAHVVNHTGGNQNSTHTALAAESGYLATGVAAIQFHFDSQENGWVGYREFVALGTAESITAPLTWTGGTGSNWIAGADNNWKQTNGGAPNAFSSTSALTFDSTGANKTINVSSPLTAFSLAFNSSSAYTIGGAALTVSNGLTVANSGNVTLNGPVVFGTDLTYTGSGNLNFNGTVQAGALTVSGSGVVTLAQNNSLSGITSVNEGTLTAASNGSLGTSALSMSSGTVKFTSPAPTVSSIAGPFGAIVLGNGAGTTNLSIGDATSVTNFGGNISNAAGSIGSLTKTGASSLTLDGDNSYTGSTTVTGGSLNFSRISGLYGGNTGSWTASNIVVGNGATLGLDVGFEFTETNINTDLSLGGFAAGSTLGLNTIIDTTLSRDLNRPGMGLRKTGPAVLHLTGNNTAATGLTKVYGGVLDAGSATTAIGGSVVLGNGGSNVYLNMAAANQFGPNSEVSIDNGTFYGVTMNLRGFNQTIAGLSSTTAVAANINIVQNDESNQTGYTPNAAALTLTLNNATDHTFRGIIRNGGGDAGAVSLVKNGPGTQELINIPVQGYGYTGPTTINQGRLKISFNSGNNGFASNIAVNSPSGIPATLEFHAVTGDLNFDREISGAGHVEVNGINAVRFTNSHNSFSGGITVGSPGIGTYNGYLALVSNPPQGAGNGPDQFCVGGAMTPGNVITVQGGATLALDGIAPLGESSVLPQYAPSVVINNSGLNGGNNNVAFVSNLTLNNGDVSLSDGVAIAGFDTNLCFVGTLVVGGDSIEPSAIITAGTGPNANASLGSGALPGTTFQVADVTGTDAVDFDVDAVLRNVNSFTSPLTKTGGGTMWMRRTNTYTGDTTVVQGELRMGFPCLADTANVSIAASGTLNLLTGGADTINRLTLAGVTVNPGTYGASDNPTPGIIQTARIKGNGLLVVTAGPETDPYAVWSAQIPNAGQRARTDDPDGDGFTNLQEYLFGTSPTASTGSLSTFQSTPSGLIVRWNQRATGTSTYVLRESATMLENPWPASTATITNSATQDIPDYVRKEALVPVNSARKFVRVVATE
ncbi:MAG: autotransporter-associated beta strand repeat-containing protein [Luteolibacter sp.]|uniref:beta strand repeat-containing protein n=1 Tax=Luteolibacter sp. TaxID=1962973 RepID=UPI003265F268